MICHLSLAICHLLIWLNQDNLRLTPTRINKWEMANDKWQIVFFARGTTFQSRGLTD
jgi:hypothetical protein